MDNSTLDNSATLEKGSQNQGDFSMENNTTNGNNDCKQEQGNTENGNGNNESNNDQGVNGDNTLSQDYSENNDAHNGNGENGDSQTNKRQASDFDGSNNNNNNNNSNYQKRQKTGMNMQGGNRNYARKDGQVDLRILLPSKDAGAIIGRGGANIKKLRQEHKTQVQVPDCNGPERLLLISGDLDTCINALLDVIPLLEENQKFNNNEGGATELRLLVHQSQAGCIIGRGGDKIKDLRIKHSLDMKVYSECAPMSTERVCQMKGKSPDIVNCLREAIGLLESAPPKGMSRPYDPHNFDEFLSSQYGGFCNDKRGGGGGGGNMQGGGRGGFNNNNGAGNRGGYNNNNGGGNRGGYNRNNSDGNGHHNNHDNGYNNNGMNRGNDRGGRGGMMNRGGDRGGRGGMGGGDRGNMRNNMNDDRRGGRGGMGGGYNNRGGNERGGGRGGYNNNGGGGRGGGRDGGYNNNNQNGGGQQNYNNNNNSNSQGNNGGSQPSGQTNQVTIPNELAGAVIGPKGAKIQQIRDQSGAGITIDKPTPGSNDRIITIQGNSEQIQNAQYLLQVTVKQSGLWQGQ